MLRLLLISCCILLFFACSEEKTKKQISTQDVVSQNKVLSFNITSKNNKATLKSGTDISMNEMTTIQIKSGQKISFKGLEFTLDNKTDSALNFYSENTYLMFDIPFDLSVMSMPPDINGATNYSQGNTIKLSGTSLIKTNYANFVISDIIFSNTEEK